MKQGSEAVRYLSFSIGSEEYAIPLLQVKEVIAMPDITSVPFTPSYFVGIMNLRGQVISVIDLRQKFGVKSQANTDTAVIICDLFPISLGIVIDSVNSVLSPSETELSEKPDIHSQKSTDYITGVYRKEKSLVLFLDLAKALSIEDKQAVNKAIQQGMKQAA